MKKPLLEKLIQEIAMFDMDAAFTLNCRKDNEEYRDEINLINAMAWRKTPEGYKHWEKIKDKLEDRRRNYHPNRDLMIEYANDKTIEIETYQSNIERWVECKEPSFYHSVKYRKKPKMTKEVIEYRIYLDTENEIHMIERKDLVNPALFKKWLGDWQKVEIKVEENN
jgi:hypothetical protein